MNTVSGFLFAAAAAISLSALSYKGPARQWRWWLPAGAAFLSGWLTGNMLIALAMTSVSSAIIIGASAAGMASPSVAIRVGLSDLLLVVGFTAHHSETGLWSIGKGVSVGQLAIAAAIVLRAAVLPADAEARWVPLTLLTVWQSAWLISEFRSIPGPLLVIGAIAVIAAGYVTSIQEKATVWIALGAGFALLLEGVGAHHWLAFAAVLAGIAGFLGQTMLSLAALVVAVAFIPGPDLSFGSVVAALLLAALVIASFNWTRYTDRRTGSQGLLTAVLALLFALVGSRSGLAWISVLLGAGFAGVWMLLMPDSQSHEEWAGPDERIPTAPAWAAPLAGGLLLLAGAAWLRLLLEGLRTQFL
ncbi:MAG TPA: hypothetical protein VND22_03625 [Actinomycetota bacterium]|nr:hypothetical protein [Actinomycetota bacterium]